MTLRTRSYGNYGIFLIMCSAGFVSSTVSSRFRALGFEGVSSRHPRDPPNPKPYAASLNPVLNRVGWGAVLRVPKGGFDWDWAYRRSWPNRLLLAVVETGVLIAIYTIPRTTITGESTKAGKFRNANSNLAYVHIDTPHIHKHIYI